MMSQPLVIFVDRGGFKVGTWADGPIIRDIALPADVTAEQIAAALDAALAELKSPGRGLTLAIPSAWCLCAAVEELESGKSSKRVAMLYQLEEHLPLTAEEIVADFIPGDGGHSLAVTTQINLLQPLIDSLERLGWVVESICPTAILAAQSYLASGKIPVFDLLLFEHAGQIEFMHIASEQLKQWDVLPVDAEDIAIAVSLFAIHHARPLRVAYVQIPESTAARLATIADIELIKVDEPPSLEAAIAAARSFNEGTETAWVQLRRDALGTADRLRQARPALNAMLVASICLVTCICAALLWRAVAYQRLAGDFEQQQRAIYETVFKGKGSADGIDIASRLTSEERRLRLLTGESSDLPTLPSALVMLQQLLSRAPADSHCQVNELRFSDGKIYIEGIAPSHADGASFVSALSADHAFEMDSPRTEQLSDGTGVAITVTGVANLTAPAKPQVKQ